MIAILLRLENEGFLEENSYAKNSFAEFLLFSSLSL
jgi:hypothetical protein